MFVFKGLLWPYLARKLGNAMFLQGVCALSISLCVCMCFMISEIYKV